MKKLYPHLLMLTFLALFNVNNVQAQDCNAVISISNVVCEGSSFNFTLSVTESGVPLNFSGSSDFNFGFENNPEIVLIAEAVNTEDNTNRAFSNEPMMGTLFNITCEEMENAQLELLDGQLPSTLRDNCTAQYNMSSGAKLQDGLIAFFPPPGAGIPTIGQWGLIILSLLLVIFSVKTIVSSQAKQTS